MKQSIKKIIALAGLLLSFFAIASAVILLLEFRISDKIFIFIVVLFTVVIFTFRLTFIESIIWAIKTLKEKSS